MNKYLFFVFLLAFPFSIAQARVSCESQFNRLEELRVSSFDHVATAPDQKACLQFAETFLKKAGKAPHDCAPGKAKEVLHAWSDSYQNDTHHALPSSPGSAFLAIKSWAHETLKRKCMTRIYE